MKHTQGEWKAVYSHSVGDNTGNAKDETTYSIFSDCEGNAVVAKIHGDIEIEEVEANAKLIAAAPELLEALQGYVDSMLLKDHQEKWFNQYKNDEQADRLLVAAIVAIKKATE